VDCKNLCSICWINPVLAEEWSYTRTIGYIREIFPMFELNLDGLEKRESYGAQETDGYRQYCDGTYLTIRAPALGLQTNVLHSNFASLNPPP